jgi:hypothetical protein
MPKPVGIGIANIRLLHTVARGHRRRQRQQRRRRYVPTETIAWDFGDDSVGTKVNWQKEGF